MESSSLLKLSKKELKSISKLTIKDRFGSIRSKTIRWLKLPNSWVLYIPLILTFYFLTVIDFDLPNIFLYKEQEIYGFIGEWLDFIIPLLSIIVVASIFIIQAIQNKNPDEELFSIVFSETWFYPILYLSLSIIAVMTFLYFRPIIIEEEIIIRAAILSLYLFLFDIVLIGFLFNRAFRFLNTDYLLDKYLIDIHFYFEKGILKEAISRLSYRIFRDKMQGNNFTENTFGIAPYNYVPVKLEYKKRQLITDIKLKKLIKLISEYDNIFFKTIFIHEIIPEQFRFLWLPQRNNLEKSIRKFIKSSDYKDKKDNLLKIKEKFKGRLDRYVIEENIQLLDQVLEHYKSLYSVFTNLLPKYNLNSIAQISSFYYANSTWEALENIERHIQLAFEKAIKHNSVEASKRLLSFVDKIFVLSIRTKCLEIFLQYKFILTLFYNAMLQNEEIKNRNMNWLSIRLRELADLYINTEIAEEVDLEKIQLLKRMQHEFFIIINRLIKRSIEVNDYNTFSRLMNELTQFRHRI